MTDPKQEALALAEELDILVYTTGGVRMSAAELAAFYRAAQVRALEWARDHVIDTSDELICTKRIKELSNVNGT